MSTVVVLIVAAAFLGMGLVALVRPLFVVERFGTTSLTRDGRNEVRAVYGGYGLAVAAILVAAELSLPGQRDGVLLAIAVSLGGMALGRLISTLLEGPPRGFVWLVFGVEVALTALLFMAR